MTGTNSITSLFSPRQPIQFDQPDIRRFEHRGRAIEVERVTSRCFLLTIDGVYFGQTRTVTAIQRVLENVEIS